MTYSIITLRRGFSEVVNSSTFTTGIASDKTEWMEEALCAEVGTEMFFPEKGGSTREAKQICGSCDVAEQCLAFALENDERFGIWGGLSERERRKLRKRRDDS